MKNIEFWFSIGSTYTYLSVTRILDVEKKHQVKFSWKPFSVRKIMKEIYNVTENITLIIITHRHKSVTNCDKVYLLDNGKKKKLSYGYDQFKSKI